MVGLMDLWLPIVLSAVLVFIASSVLHMVLPLHRKDHKKMAGEESVLEAMRSAKVTPGSYYFPFPDDGKDIRTPEMLEKLNRGPVGFATVVPNGTPAMGKSLAIWFVYCLVISVFAAYLAGRTLGPGVEYMMVFRITATASFLGYSGALAIDSIWMARPWRITFKHMFDGLVYSLLTAGAFGWLWP